MSIKISIITTTYNDKENLVKIMQSLLEQDYVNYEYIVVDGGSKDETIEYLREMEPVFGGKLVWSSQPDEGIYDAINKGIKQATGDVVGFLFDEYANSGVLTLIADTFEMQSVQGIHGDIDYLEDGKVVRKWRMKHGKMRLGWMPGHPTLYLKKSVYDTFGLYKTDYRVAGDYEFMIRILFSNQIALAYIPQVLVHMSHGGNSASTGGLKSYLRSLKEGHRALRENKVRAAFITDILRTIRVLIQFI